MSLSFASRLSRRSLLAVTGATAGLAAGLTRRSFAASAPPRSGGGLLACAQALDGRYLLQSIDARAAPGPALALPDRGHGVAMAPTGREAVVLARRPGAFAVVFDRVSLTPLLDLESPPDRHFQGHAAYSSDGRWLYATENDFEAGAGVVGLYDARNGYRRVSELPSGGIGPHDCALTPDGRELLVANGGIRTHPDLPREKLNIDTMRPNLARIDLRSGAVVARYALAPDLHKLSIRHLALSPRGDVVIGLQDEHETPRDVPLVATLGSGAGSLRLLDAAAAVWRRMNQYVGSVGMDERGTTLVATAPRGNAAACWSVSPQAGGYAFAGLLSASDVGGVCRGTGATGLRLTGGDGTLRSASLDGNGRLAEQDKAQFGIAFDNHAFAL